ncbi:hypothetical protein Y887_08535 [Xanthomonas pisi DSM 18956]|nr:hypothetical protein Y887_08535 [Xanthomonas pisi DSM 18956]
MPIIRITAHSQGAQVVQIHPQAAVVATHGAALVAGVLTSLELRDLWEQELTEMRERIHSLRAGLVEKLATLGSPWPVRHQGRNRAASKTWRAVVRWVGWRGPTAVSEWRMLIPNIGRVRPMAGQACCERSRLHARCGVSSAC